MLKRLLGLEEQASLQLLPDGLLIEDMPVVKLHLKDLKEQC